MDYSSDSDKSEIQPVIEPLRDETNFYRWKTQITALLETRKLWALVSGGIPRPALPASESPASTAESTPERKKWDDDAIEGAMILRNHMGEELGEKYSYHTPGPAIWSSLMWRFHPQDAASLIRSFETVRSLRFVEESEQTIIEYLEIYDSVWEDFIDRTSDGPAPVAGRQNSLLTALKVVALSEESKAEYLIDSLPISLIREVSLMRPRAAQEFGYWELRNLLRNIHARLEYEKRLAATRQVERRNALDCTWCKSRKFKSKGHSWEQCRRLMKHKGIKAKGCGKRG